MTSAAETTPPPVPEGAELQQRSNNVGNVSSSTEDEGPVIRVAASRSRRIVPETSGHGNALVMDSKTITKTCVGRKMSRKVHCGILWLIKDCCGMFCAVLTWFLIGYAEFVMWFVIYPSKAVSLWNLILWQIFSFLAFFSHCRAMLSDPGAIPIGNCTMENLRRLGYTGQPKAPDQDQPTIIYKCPRCACIKPEKSHHCSICRRCIFKMDHHCPWVNNCVGMLNQKFFILFTLYICLMSAHAIIIDLQFLFTCFGHIDPHASSREPGVCLRPPRPGTDDESHYITLSTGIILVIFNLFEAVIFSLFTAIMCGTQIHALCTEISSIDQLKRLDAEQGKSEMNWAAETLQKARQNKQEKESCMTPLMEAFGDKHPPNFKWLSPFHHHRLRRPGFLQPLDDGEPKLSSIRTA